jgi:hypothetical protein
VQLDHIILAVRDLDVAAGSLEREHGLTSYFGGTHPHWGTANRIVPLGTSYLELLAVVDDRTAAASDVGRWVADGASVHGAPIGWAVRPDDFDATAQRLGLTAHTGSRTRPDGVVVRWRMAGIEHAFREPQLPFFIEWTDVATYPGAAQGLDVHIESVELEGSAAKLDTWLGEHALSLDIRPGRAGVRRVVLTYHGAEVVLGGQAV